MTRHPRLDALHRAVAQPATVDDLLDQAAAVVADQPCPHESWEVGTEHRVPGGWEKTRTCTDCREPLAPVVEREPHWPEHATDTTREDISDALAFNDDTASPALATVRDLILTLPSSTPASALASARVILSAHARELADATHAEARKVGAAMRERGDRSRVAHCGGRHAVIADLRRHADDLDAQAAESSQ